GGAESFLMNRHDEGQQRRILHGPDVAGLIQQAIPLTLRQRGAKDVVDRTIGTQIDRTDTLWYQPQDGDPDQDGREQPVVPNVHGPSPDQRRLTRDPTAGRGRFRASKAPPRRRRSVGHECPRRTQTVNGTAMDPPSPDARPRGRSILRRYRPGRDAG